MAVNSFDREPSSRVHDAGWRAQLRRQNVDVLVGVVAATPVIDARAVQQESLMPNVALQQRDIIFNQAPRVERQYRNPGVRR